MGNGTYTCGALRVDVRGDWCGASASGDSRGGVSGDGDGGRREFAGIYGNGVGGRREFAGMMAGSPGSFGNWRWHYRGFTGIGGGGGGN